MSGRAFTLPLRLASASKPQASQWVCKRCLATQATPVSSSTGAQLPTGQRTSETPEDYNPHLSSAQRDYPLSKVDFNLKKALPHAVPINYLRHTTSDVLPAKEKAMREKVPAHNEIVGVVVSAGKMDKTVKVRVPTQVWNKKIEKHFGSHVNHLVHDPNSSLVAGDVVSLHRLQVSAAVRHVVASIVAPFGTPIDSRPPIPTADERLAEYKEKRFVKLKRRALRQAAARGDEEAMKQVQAMAAAVGQEIDGSQIKTGKATLSALPSSESARSAKARAKAEREVARKLKAKADAEAKA